MIIIGVIHPPTSGSKLIIITGAKITSIFVLIILMMLLLLLPMLLLIGRWLPSRLAGLGIIVAIVHLHGSEVVSST